MGIGRFISDSVLERSGDLPLPIVLASYVPGLMLGPGGRGISVAEQSGLIGNSHCGVDVYLDGYLIDNFENVLARDLVGRVHIVV